jgi:hypothetical protein
VSWDEKITEGQPEPRHPAPSFTTANDGTASASDAAAPPRGRNCQPIVQGSGDGASIWAIVLGAGRFVLGAAALGLGLTGRRTRAVK